MSEEFKLVPDQLQDIVVHVLALDVEFLKECRADSVRLQSEMPEGHWMVGMIGVALASMDAMLEYRQKLDDIAKLVVPPGMTL